MPKTFTETEQEIVILKSVWELIDELVNYLNFEKIKETTETSLMFKSSTTQRIFNILLVDFLSRPGGRIFGFPKPEGDIISENSLLFLLKIVCENPRLNPKEAELIKSPLDSFVLWLETECKVEGVWFPSINVEKDLKVKRGEFIKICGTIGKHNFLSLDGVVKNLEKILERNGINITEGEGYLIIPEFYDWFHSNILGYHASAIAEFLNNIRWGIYEYLKPEFDRAYYKENTGSKALPFREGYKYPTECTNSLIKPIYYELMNLVRKRPFIPRFEVSRYLKMRY